MDYPKSIEPSPVREAVVEIRFSSDLPADAIFGILYSNLRETYSKVESLPILQLPETFRNTDKNLLFQPHHKLIKDNFVIQAGPRVFSLSMMPPNTRWSDFLPEMTNVFTSVRDAGFVSEISRLGLRYINDFEGPMLNNLNVDLRIMGEDVSDQGLYLRNLSTKDGFGVLLQIVHSGSIDIPGAEIDKEQKSTIDTDVWLKEDGIDFFNNSEALLERIHSIHLSTFYGLLKEEYLLTLNPQY